MREVWSTKALEELATVERGKFSARPRNDPRYYGGDTPFIQTGDIASSNGTIRTWKQSLNDQGVAVSRVFEKGTIFITIAANIGDVAVAEFAAACPDSVVAIQPFPNVDRGWLLQVLRLKKPDLEAAAPANAQKNINLEVLRPLAIETPPLAEQRRIAEILHTWDEGIEKTERLIAAKERRLSAVIDRAYDGYEGRFVSFGELLTESQIAGTDGARAKKLTVKLYGKGVVPKALQTEGSAETRYFVRRAGQLMYGKLDFLNGAFGIVPPELDGYESTLDLPAFDISPDVNPIWLLEYLRRPSYYSQQTGLSRGQRIARRVNPQEFLSSELKVPDRAHQDLVANAISSMRAELDLLRRQRDAVGKQKRGLMQKLLTGEWSVGGESKEEVAA